MRVNHHVLLVSVGALCACEPFDAYVEPSEPTLPCCGGVGVCVYAGLMAPETEQRLARAECQEPLLCAPSSWLLDMQSAPASCRAPGDLEGRCLPSCLPELAEQTGRLQQQSCEAGYLCAPCFDPLTGEDTQACRIGPDPGPSEPARMAEPCCAGTGRCMPSVALEAFDAGDLQHVGAADCPAESDLLCVPSAWLTLGHPPESACPDTCLEP